MTTTVEVLGHVVTTTMAVALCAYIILLVIYAIELLRFVMGWYK